MTHRVSRGVYPGEKDYLSSSDGHGETQTYLRQRLINITSKKNQNKNKQTNKQNKTNNSMITYNTHFMS